MRVNAPPVQTHSISAMPSTWEWNLAAGYYELVLTPVPHPESCPDLFFAGFRLRPLLPRPQKDGLWWTLFVPSRGKWPLMLTGPARSCPNLPWQLAARRLPVPLPGAPPAMPPRGVWLGEAPDDAEAAGGWLYEAMVRGATFAFGSHEHHEKPGVAEALEAHGLLAIRQQVAAPRPPETRGKPALHFWPLLEKPETEKYPVPGVGVSWSGWLRGGAMSPMSDCQDSPESDGVVPWLYHVTTNGTLTLKHAAWADLAEVWYHPANCVSMSHAQGLLLARVRGEGFSESATPGYSMSLVPGGWQVQLPPCEQTGLLHLRWVVDQAPVGATTFRTNTQLLGTCISAIAAGDVYYPCFRASESGMPTILAGTGNPPPEAVGLLRSRLDIRHLWKVSPSPGRRTWPEGVACLRGYEQPSRTKDVLIGIRIAPLTSGSLLLLATLAVETASVVRWRLSRRAPTGDAPFSEGEVKLGPGLHQLLIPAGTSAEGQSLLLTAPRRAVRLRALEGLSLPVSVLMQSRGPYWVETEFVTQLLLDKSPVRQHWTVRMMRGLPWVELRKRVPPETTDTPGAPQQLTFEIPRYDRVFVNGRPIAGTGSVTRKVRLVVLKDSGELYPNLALIPSEEGAEWTVQQVGTVLTVSARAGTPCECIVAVGKLDRWGGANTIRESVARLIRPVSLSPDSRVTLKNTQSKAVAALAQVMPGSSGPYWVREGGWWRRVESQACTREGAPALLLPVHIPGRSSVVLSQETYLSDSVRCTPGSQSVLSLSEPEPEGVVVRASSPSPFGTPLGVEFRRPFVSVTCNGHPWHVHDGKRVWLPAGEGRYRLRVAAFGEPSPTIISPSLPVISTRWTGARLTIRLAGRKPAEAKEPLVVRYPRDALAWMGVEGGSGEVVSPEMIRVRPTAQAVHLRFLPQDAVRSSE